MAQPLQRRPVTHFTETSFLFGIMVYMGEISQFGRLFILAGIFLLILGGLFLLGDKIPFLGKLPGDILIKRGNSSFYFPLATCIVVSIVISIILNLINRK